MQRPSNLPNRLMATDEAQIPSGYVSGRKVVFGMFALGLTATAILWFYWHFHLMPFMPLQKAIADKFQDSAPRVDGGRRKLQEDTPMILRVQIRVPFDPTETTADSERQSSIRLKAVEELANEHAALSEYEVLQVHMYYEHVEKQLLQQLFSRRLSDDATWERQEISR